MAQFIFSCPFCRQQFVVADEMIGQNVTCPNCRNVSAIQRSLQPLPASRDPNLVMLILGILSLILWIIPLFTLPIPIIGFIMSYNKNYRLGIILNTAGFGVSILWTIVCMLAAMD
ncbi:MAG: hypothetical protein E7055_09525 [Lentisphaerae bacterium]|jgi:hypothetical protein|nr:hypothetical protein [Lentisphaerota bacterium]